MKQLEGFEYYTSEHISKHFEVAPETVRRWIRQGKLKAKKIGKHYIVRHDDFKKFMEKGTTKTQAKPA